MQILCTVFSLAVRYVPVIESGDGKDDSFLYSFSIHLLMIISEDK